MMIEDIKNFVRVSDKIASAGQPTEIQIKELHNSGYSTVINLVLPDQPGAIPNEGYIVTQLSMSYIHIPININDPKPKQLKQFCLIMQSLEREKVFVHCLMNYRASAFMYHYLSKIVGLNEAQSKSEILASWKPDDTWISLLKWSAADIGL